MDRSWASVALLAAALPVVAQEQRVPAAGNTQFLNEVTSAATATVDRSHAKLSNLLLDTVERVDNFLHDTMTPAEEEALPLIGQFYGDRRFRSSATSGSYVTITPEITFSDDPVVDTSVDFSAHLKLRRVSDRLELFVDRFDDDADLLDGVLGRLNQKLRDNNEEGGAGLLYHLPDYFALKSSMSVGVAFKPAPVLRLKLRERLTTRAGRWQVRLSEIPFWESDDGFGEKTELALIRPLSTDTVLRSTSGAVWSETSEGVDLGHAFVVSHSLSRRRSISFRAGVAGHTEPSAIVDGYSGRATWRQRVFRDWLYLEIEPGVDFTDENDFKATPLLSLRFDIVLGAVDTEP